MPRLTKIAKSPPAAVEKSLKGLGSNIRIARLRRKIRLEDLAERIGVSRFALADAEKGKPTTSIVVYAGALWALGLLAEMSLLADPDRDSEGKALERVRSPKKAHPPKALDNDF
ncbi:MULTISPECIES: helix-turn-helix transcriptional regulator [Sinorhizobium]|uniref:helix-turn-helix transcriptional regulator n=1 Tax=Sinorhizobium TaxID=28105 RepID=UPI000405843E|nr:MULTISPECIES: helix-turn-helix domain-containing protein [Sinorhizobium]WOS67190.1 transcriptional regulator [Sinorhizobium fredii GR64]